MCGETEQTQTLPPLTSAPISPKDAERIRPCLTGAPLNGKFINTQLPFSHSPLSVTGKSVSLNKLTKRGRETGLQLMATEDNLGSCRLSRPVRCSAALRTLVGRLVKGRDPRHACSGKLFSFTPGGITKEDVFKNLKAES